MKDKSSRHSDNLPGWNGSLEELADAIATMSYDSLQHLLQSLGARLVKDSKADEARGRTRLANRLRLAGVCLKLASDHLLNAWDICKPYMKKDSDNESISFRK